MIARRLTRFARPCACCSTSSNTLAGGRRTSPAGLTVDRPTLPASTAQPRRERRAGRIPDVRTDRPNSAERQQNKVPQNSPSLPGEFAVCSGPNRGGNGSALSRIAKGGEPSSGRRIFGRARQCRQNGIATFRCARQKRRGRRQDCRRSCARSSAQSRLAPRRPS